VDGLAACDCLVLRFGNDGSSGSDGGMLDAAVGTTVGVVGVAGALHPTGVLGERCCGKLAACVVAFWSVLWLRYYRS
jgi:hypothetical protein